MAQPQPARGGRALRGDLPERLLDALGQAVVCTDPDGVVVYWNGKAEQLFGWTAAEAVGRPISSLTVVPVARERAEEVLAALAAGRSWTGTSTVRRRDGTTFTALVSDSGLYDAEGRLEAVVSASLDLGDVVRPYLVHSSEATLVTDADGTILCASTAVDAAFGWPDSDLVGRSLTDVVHPRDRSVLAAARAAVSSSEDAAGMAPVLELRVLTGSGAFRWVELRWSDLRGDPTVRGLLWTLRDVDERHAALDRMTDLALNDHLTGLPNRAVLVERIAHAVARRDRRGALLFLDLDDFKAVNDTLGHACGDQLLRVVAARLREAVRPEDTCGRFGGDEFVVLAETVGSREKARALAARLAAAVARPAEVQGAVLHPQVSVGLSMLGDGDTVDHVLHAADRDMYRVKAERRAARDASGQQGDPARAAEAR